jgi:hypothetical protein
MFRTIGLSVLTASLAAGLAAAPAVARPDGMPSTSTQKPRPDKPEKAKGPKAGQTKTVLKFTKSVKRKLRKDGIRLSAVEPAMKRNNVKFVFPAEAMVEAIDHEGGLKLTRGDKSLTITDFAFDLSDKTVDVTVPGVGTVEDALALKRVKITKKRHVAMTRVAVGDGTAEVLNTALDSELFTDGMFLAKSRTK